MKKILVSALLVLGVLSASAQVVVNDVDINKEDIEYCQLLGYAKLLSLTKVTIGIDYGQKQKAFEDQRIAGSDGKPVVFNSMIDGLNFMKKNGWEYINSYVVTTGQSNTYHYLLKRVKEGTAE